MGGSSDAPAPIDPAEAIRAQAEANRVDLNSPFGGQRYAQGADGRWSLNSYLSPEMQGLADQMIGRAGQGPQQFGIPGYDQLMGDVMSRVSSGFQGSGQMQGAGGLGTMGSGIGQPKQMGGQLMPPPQMGQSQQGVSSELSRLAGRGG